MWDVVTMRVGRGYRPMLPPTPPLQVDRTVAQGWRQFITRILGTLPAPLVFGFIIDNACTIWREIGGEQGNCWVYDVQR